jgi:hypothetical protein
MRILGSMLLSEPVGLLALLGIPIALVIFLFHRRAKRIPVSTLFLVHLQSSTDTRGRSLDTLKNSLSLWMTLLFVLLLAWVLSKPLFISEKITQKIVVVLDSSVSMRAFLPKGLQGIRSTFDQINQLSPRTDWILLESSTHAPPLYQGSEVLEASKSLDNWSPDLGTHSPLAQVDYAKVVAGPSGMVLFISDRHVELPAGVSVMTIGSTVENVGFVGISEQPSESGNVGRRVLIKNYSSSVQNRTLRMGNALPQPVALAPHEIIRIFLPTDENAEDGTPFELHLSQDTFPIDDVLLLLPAKPKAIRVAIVPTDVRYAILRRVLGVVHSIIFVDSSSNPDVVIGESILTRGEDSHANLFFPPPRAASEVLSRAPITAVHHQFTEGLQFEGLLVPPCRPFVPKFGDRVLVWQGETPMIVALKGESLYLNFDLSNERISRHPALVVLLHRYLNGVRKELKVPETRTFDGGQILDLPDVDGEELRFRTKSILTGEESQRIVSHAEVKTLRAPVLPSFFSVSTESGQILTGVSNFADPRESDFSNAQTIPLNLKEQQQIMQLNAERDSLRNIWLVVAILAALASWIPLKDMISFMRNRI